MNADVKEFEDKYLLELELPGFSKEDLKAELKDGKKSSNTFPAKLSSNKLGINIRHLSFFH